MAKQDSTAPTKSSSHILCDALHDISARQAGLESLLIRLAEEAGNSDDGNLLWLAVYTARDAKENLSKCADQAGQVVDAK